MCSKTYINKTINKIALGGVGISLSFLFVLEAVAQNDNSNSGQSNSNSNVQANNSNANGNSNQNATVNDAILKQKQAQLREKQAQLDNVKSQISVYEKKSNILDQKTSTIESMLSLLDSEINNMEAAVNKTQTSLDQAQEDVNNKEHEITLKQDEIDKRKMFLGEYVRGLNLLDKKSMLEVLLEKERLSDYFQEIENIITFQGKLKGMLLDLHNARAELEKQNEDLNQILDERMSLYYMQEEQRIELEQDKKDREALLAETKNEQGQVQGELSAKNVIASRLSAEITSLQSLGTKIDFGTALTEAKVVAGLTGVRATVLLGVLKVESNMGANVGGGRYSTDMNPAQWDRFKNICQELGYDPTDRPVSRKPCYRDSSGNCSGWGGAMGPAQFMPSTWMGYKADVASVTGHNPPDPWNLRDALTAMGLKLAKVEGVTSHDRESERKAASIYLAGGNWQKFTWYGDRVMKFADTYDGQM